MEKLRELGIDFPSLIAFLVNFAILMGVLYLVAYKPILRMLDERSRRVKESMDQAEALKEQVAKGEEQIQAHLAEARKETQGIAAQATQMGERLKEEARVQARQEAEAIIVRARAEIQRERDTAIDELRRQFADLAVLAAGKIIKERVDRAAHQRLIDEVLEESTRQGRS